MITIIDYGRGNLFSLRQALLKVGADVSFATEPADIAASRKIIVPGVGAFGDVVSEFKARGLRQPLLDAALSGIPILGICVGMQMLATTGEEFGSHAGLGLIPGSVRKLPNGVERIPNVGWRQLALGPSAARLGLQDSNAYFYFVHSFAMACDRPEDVAATLTFNGAEATVAVARDNVAGVQFHPEKSGEAGLAFLRRFVNQS